MAAYQRARHFEEVEEAFGLGSPFRKEFSQFLTTIPCPHFLAEEARSDFGYYRELIDEGFSHSFMLRYVGERREGAGREVAIDSVFSRLDGEDKFDFLYDYLLAHGKSERCAEDCASDYTFLDREEGSLAEALAAFQAREQEEVRMLGLGFSFERAYAYAKAIDEEALF